jgi:hypothetical protein
VPDVREGTVFFLIVRLDHEGNGEAVFLQA